MALAVPSACADLSAGVTPITLEVTGTQAGPETQIQAFAYALALPGVGPSNAPVPPPAGWSPRVLRAGAVRSLTIPAPVAGGAALPVTVVNRTIPVVEPTFLMFSDHPEKVLHRGLLFSAGLIRLRPVRFQYYHEGHPQAGGPRYLALRVYNPGPEAAILHLISGIGGPYPDAFKAGHKSAMAFLGRLSRGEGVILKIPPGASVDIARHTLDPGAVVSGICQFTVLSGGPLSLYLFALEQPDEPVSHPKVEDPSDVHARGVYTLTRLWQDLALSSTAPEVTCTMGDVPLGNLFPGSALKGTYGALFEAHAMLHNDGPAPREVGVIVNPRGGPAAASLLVNGRLREAGVTKAYQEVRVDRVTVPPHSTVPVTILTLPEGASNYPVRIILRWL